MAEDFAGMIADRIRGERQAKLMREREMYRTNPSRLADSGMPSNADLPGYDPTQAEGASTARFDPVFNAIANSSGDPTVQFSRPMTPEQSLLERDRLRKFYPAPSASAAPAAGGYDINAILRQFGIGGVGNDAKAAAVNTARNMPGGSPTSAPAPANAAPVGNLGLPMAEPPAALYGFNAATPRQDEGRSDSDALFQSLMGTSQRRPSTPAPAASAPAASADPSFMSRLFGGPDFQSNSQAVVSRPQGPMSDGAPQRATLNWGDSDNAADFFRADKAMQGLRKNDEEFVGMASGGAANGSSSKAAGSGRDAAIYKALEIIHHMMVNRR
jgi:hypothetical protein